MKEVQESEGLEPCPLCGRLMFKGDSVDRHHWQPKSRGGKAADYLHRTCHRKLHSLFTDKELAAEMATPAQVLRHPEMQKFIKWVRHQPPERVVRHCKPRPKP
jgi:hypothetical protein